MKYLLPAIFIFLGFSATAQESILLKGKIDTKDLEGTSINIINLTQKTGTINSSNGEFEILVRENDILLFSSILFENIEVEITPKIFRKQNLQVFLIEDVNELAEVNINNYHLTGNLSVDTKAIKTYDFPVLSLSFGDVKNARFESDVNDPQGKVTNIALGESTGVDGSIKILNILSAAAKLAGVGKGETVNRAPLPRNNPEEIRKLFSDDFFTETLEIDYDFINDFIFYAYDNGLGALVQEKKNDLELIDFFIVQSKTYRELKAQN